MNELHLFAGAGGGILGSELLGHRTVCAVEIERYPRNVLLQRQRDGILPWFPIWDDVRTFDGKPWRGIVDIVSGGFPCTDVSAAKNNAEGIRGAKSGLWSEMERIVGEIRPRFVFVENSPMLVSRGLTHIIGDLAVLGYDLRWVVVGADDAEGCHRRKRIWILAYPKGIGHRGRMREEHPEDKRILGQGKQQGSPLWSEAERRDMGDDWFEKTFSGHLRVDYGLPDWVDRLKAIGNAQVPRVAAIAFSILSEGLL
jgi:DNA (cytosine-5)-methyltransferase 1